MRCDKCIFCKKIISERAKTIYECHFNAPLMLSGAGSGWSDQLWPHVEPDDFCNEFKNKDEE